MSKNINDPLLNDSKKLNKTIDLQINRKDEIDEIVEKTVSGFGFETAFFRTNVSESLKKLIDNQKPDALFVAEKSYNSPLENFSDDTFMKRWAFEFITFYANLLSKDKLEYLAYKLLEHWIYGKGVVYNLSRLDIDTMFTSNEQGLTWEFVEKEKYEPMVIQLINSYDGKNVNTIEIQCKLLARGVKTATLGNFEIEFDGVIAVDSKEWALIGWGIYTDKYDFDIKWRNLLATEDKIKKYREKYSRPQGAEVKVIAMRFFQVISGQGQDFEITSEPIQIICRKKIPGRG